MLEPFRPSVMAARGFLVPTVRVRVLGAELPANAGAAKQKSGDNVERTVIILAAGQGKRMHSALPKVLHEMGDKTLLGHAVAAAQGINPDRLCVVVRHERDQAVAHINQIAPEAVVADQDEIPGTGRAVACALEKLAETKPVTGTCVVTSGDVPLLESQTLSALVAAHEEAGAAVTLLSTKVADPTGYGRILRDADGNVKGIVEHRDASSAQLVINEINAGIYAFDAEFLQAALQNLDTDNDQGEVYLTDTVAIAVKDGLGAAAHILADSVQAEGVNTPEQLGALAKIYAERRSRR